MVYIILLSVSLVGACYFLFTYFKENKVLLHDLERYKAIRDIEAAVKIMEADMDALRRLNECEKTKLEKQVGNLKEELSHYETKLLREEASFYHPKFEFESVNKFEQAMVVIKEAEKVLIKNKRAVVKTDSGEAVSNKVDKNLANIVLTAINAEANEIVSKVSFNNFEACRSRLEKLRDKINKNLIYLNLEVSEDYMKLKIKEMALAYDYREAIEDAREQQRELKEQMREEEAARTEAENNRKKAIKEQKMYEEAIQKAQEELASKSDEERATYEQKLRDLEQRLVEATAEKERATSMAQITKKGNVYIISNIGSFGENIFKIGMTRRQNPEDRVKELGDASVPFAFDIHAMIETDNAPELEKELHKRFDEKRLNKVNPRKEFFNVSIGEIEQICTELAQTVELTKLAKAQEYRESLEIAQSPSLGTKAA